MLNIESKMETFARTYARDTGIEIKMGSQFCTNGKTIYIVPVTDQHDPWVRFMTEVVTYHETGHIKTGDVEAIKSFSDGTKKYIYNVVRDVVVENVMETEYKGLKEKWAEFLVKFMDKNDYGKRPALQALVGLLYIKGREKLLGVKIKAEVSPAIQELFDKRLARFVDPICDHTDVKTSLTLTEEIYDAIKEDPIPEPEPEPEQPQGNGKSDDQSSGGGNSDAQNPSGESGGSKGAESSDGVSEEVSPDVQDDTDDSEGKGSGSDDDVPGEEDSGVGSGGGDEGDQDNESGAGDGESESTGDQDGGDSSVGTGGDGEGSGEGEGDGEGEGSSSGGKGGGKGHGGSLSDAASDALKDVQEQADDQGDKDTIIDQAEGQINDYVSTHQVYRTVEGLKEEFYKQNPSTGWEAIVGRHETEGRKMVGILGGKLKRLFISERAPIKVHNVRSGRLDVRKLYKLRTGARDICWRKTTGSFEDAAVFTVIDNSGSMHGEGKNEIAQGILTVVSNDLDKLRIPFGAVGFTSYGEGNYQDGVRRVPCCLNQIKDFNEPYRRVRHRFVWPSHTSGTVELPAIQYAGQQLAMRRETKKVLFILTDGETASGDDALDSALRAATKEYIQRMIRAGIRVVGIGIIDTHIAEYCPDFIHVSDLAKFASEFYQKLTKLIT